MFKSKGVIDWENEIQENALEKDHHEKIQKMIQKNFSKEIILDLGYTEEEYAKAEKELLTTV